MGYFMHHAMILTSWDRKHIEPVHEKALEIARSKVDETGRNLEVLITPLFDAHMNGYVSFAVLPDGSKEGWPDSDHGDELRNELKAYLSASHFFGEWVEVTFGESPARIEAAKGEVE